jgi:hypothetical protein
MWFLFTALAKRNTAKEGKRRQANLHKEANKQTTKRE